MFRIQGTYVPFPPPPQPNLRRTASTGVLFSPDKIRRSNVVIGAGGDNIVYAGEATKNHGTYNLGFKISRKKDADGDGDDEIHEDQDETEIEKWKKITYSLNKLGLSSVEAGLLRMVATYREIDLETMEKRTYIVTSAECMVLEKWANYLRMYDPRKNSDYANQAIIYPHVIFKYVMSAVHMLKILEMIGVVHGDLNVRNIVVKEGHNEQFSLCGIDFGSSTILESKRPNNERGCTPLFSAPERFAGEPVTSSHDMYSMGQVLLSILGNSLVFEHVVPDGPGFPIRFALSFVEYYQKEKNKRKDGHTRIQDERQMLADIQSKTNFTECLEWIAKEIMSAILHEDRPSVAFLEGKILPHLQTLLPLITDEEIQTDIDFFDSRIHKMIEDDKKQMWLQRKEVESTPAEKVEIRPTSAMMDNFSTSAAHSKNSFFTTNQSDFNAGSFGVTAAASSAAVPALSNHRDLSPIDFKPTTPISFNPSSTVSPTGLFQPAIRTSKAPTPTKACISQHGKPGKPHLDSAGVRHTPSPIQYTPAPLSATP